MSFTVTVSGFNRNDRGSGTPTIGLIARNSFASQLETDIEQTFFNQTEFGETVTYYHSGLDVWETYYTIYDDPHMNMQFGATADFNSLRPQIQVQESKLLHPIQKQDLLKLRGINYLIEDYESDGVGITTIYMHRFK